VFIFCIILAVIFGCCVGSFLNVVVYRLPLGVSLSYPSSHCPKCKHLIRPYDNIPVLGWFLLLGRCRDCRSWISFRYPFVEAVSGLVAGSVSGAIYYSGVSVSYFEFVIISLYYFGLIITLFAAGLIEFDRNIVQAKLFMPIIIVIPAASYYLRQIEFYTRLNNSTLSFTITAIIISCVIAIISFRYYLPEYKIQTKQSLLRKKKKNYSKKFLISELLLQKCLPLFTAVVISVSCGVVAVPVLFFVTIISIIFWRYRRVRRLYLLLTGATWMIIIYVLANGK
jgi:prepilin signal peptidase PulO-like enzyme (type II secretory pathway)